ncbi:MAG: hypothetical protein LBU39_04670 [Desulfobulbaceae bacterium]|jgi:cell division protein FtsI (penicillin-binding protein 3)|nr:hypothetical protein [Desulfobulbaceae bacterium]
MLAASLFLFLGIFAVYVLHKPIIAWIGAVQRVIGHSDKPEEQRRGTIYDRNFAELAVSRQLVSVQSRAREIVSFEETAARLAPVVEQSREELLKKMKEASRSILASGISRDQEERITTMNMRGISIIRKPVRSYPQEAVAGHLIGYAENGVGLSGAEYAYDRVPLQFAGRLQKAGIPSGPLPDVMLTLDLKIQDLIETLVKTISGNDRRTRVGAYIMDLDQGQMLAAAQWPAMNPNIYRQYEPDDLDGIITQAAPLPAKFRLFLRDAAILQSGFENGKAILPWAINAERADLGNELLLWNKLKFSDQTRPDFANQEMPGRGEEKYFDCPSFAGRDFGSTPQALSPLRLLTGIGILAADGESLQPFAVAAALNPNDRDKEKRVIVDLTDDQENAPEAAPEFVAKEAMRMFTAMAAPGRTEAGGAPIFYDQIDCRVSDGENVGPMRHQLYMAAVPEKDPQYVLLITARKSGFGVPTQDERTKADDMAEIDAILERVLMFVEVGRGLRGYAAARADSSGAYSTSRDRWRRGILNSGNPKEDHAPTKEWLMPDMVGMSLRRGLRLLNGAPCRIEISGSGEVLRQDPAVGKPIKTDSVCRLFLRDAVGITIEKIKARNRTEAENAPPPLAPPKTGKQPSAKQRNNPLLDKIREQIKSEGQKTP